jgi:hypothetical protein
MGFTKKGLLSFKTMRFTKKKRQTPNNQNQFSDIDKVEPTIQMHPDSGGVKSFRNDKRPNYRSYIPWVMIKCLESLNSILKM